MRLLYGILVFMALANADQIPLGQQPSSSRPNIVVILTDDQDYHMDSLNYMPLLKKHIIDKGTHYQKHYCTTAVCCPSRVTLWTGKYSHNTNVTDVTPPHGGFPKFVSQGLNEKYLPVWLQENGYNTFYTGKLFNAHTVLNYNKPYPAGWTSTSFLVDPFTYEYWNATFQRNQDPPKSFEGFYNTDVLAQEGYNLLEEAVSLDKPFFLTFAPIAPHSEVSFGQHSKQSMEEQTSDRLVVKMTEPKPAERHKDLFEDAKVPRTANFNPDTPGGASWIQYLGQLTDEMIEYNDFHYRRRLQSLQAVDEIVEGVVERLEEYGILDNTYIIYTTDNGFHISQHRLAPGKECSFEEDINIPFIVRGPNVPEGQVTNIVTAHTDFAPTIMNIVGAPLRDDFDGSPIPLTADRIAYDKKHRQEHVNVEFWGGALAEGTGGYSLDEGKYVYYGKNNTYKNLRLISEKYDLSYTVWCTNEHELYDMKVDPGQLHNIYPSGTGVDIKISGYPLSEVIPRLDALLMITKSCKGSTCVDPWRPLHPDGSVKSLGDALESHHNALYALIKDRVSFDRCEMGYFPDAEGPQAAEFLQDLLLA